MRRRFDVGGGRSVAHVALAPALASTLALLLPSTAGAAAQLCFGKKATKIGNGRAQTIVGTPRNDVIVALGGNDVIRGLGGNDRICAGSGNDLVDGGAGADRVSGGLGQDTLTFAKAPAAVVVSLARGTARGEGRDAFSSIERLDGSRFDDELTGSGTANRLSGGAGDDTLFGLGGHDLLLGETGDDFLIGSAGNDAYDGGVRTFDIALFAGAPGPVSVDLALGAASGEGADTLSGVEGVVGGAASDVLRGDAGFNLLFGARGNDVLEGRAGTDLVGFLEPAGPVSASLAAGSATGEGSDSLLTVEGLAGSPLADTLTGSGGNDLLLGLGGADQLAGGAGADLVSDGEGADLVDGGTGNDRIYAGAGNDQIEGGPGGFDLFTLATWPGAATVDLGAGTASGAGSDTLSGIEVLQGTAFADTLTGSNTADLIAGLGGNDTLLGLGGNDLLDGDAGSDTLDGGSGTDDTCIEGESNPGCENIVAGDPGLAGRDASDGDDRLRVSRGVPPLSGEPPLAPDEAPPGSASARRLVPERAAATAAVPASYDLGIVNCWLRFAGATRYDMYVEHPWFPAGVTTAFQEKERFIPRLYQYDFGVGQWVPAQDGNNGWGHWVYVWPNSAAGLITIPFGGPWIGETSRTTENSQGWVVNNGWFFRMAAWVEWRAPNGAEIGHVFRWIDSVYGAHPSGPWCFG